MPEANTDHKLRQFSHAAAETLRRAKEPIMAAWETAVKQDTSPEYASPTPSQLRDSLPKLLDNLALALEDPHWTYRQGRNIDIARYHGYQRLHLHYSLEQMIDEYAILRQNMVTAMQETQLWPAPIMARVHAFLDAAVRAAADEFSQRQKQIEVKKVEDELKATAADRDAHRQLVSQLEEEKLLRSRFVALLTHDLNNPLTVIRLSCQRINKKCDDPSSIGKLTERMQQATLRMEQMIRDMLDATRAQAGQNIPLQIKHCDLADISSRAIDGFMASGGNRFYVTTPNAFMGYWDPSALIRMIENMVGNAVKYGPAGTRISIALDRVDDNACFSVHNFGVPIPEEDLANIFDVYVRAKVTQSSSQQGWGLGLYLVRAVAEAHGGSVGASSDADAGTCFWFKIPIDCRAKT